MQTMKLNLKGKVRPLVSAVFKPVHTALWKYMLRSGLVYAAGHTSTETMTGTVYSISAGLPATYDASGYGATTITWTVIGSVINFMPYGADRDVQKIKPINGAVEKIKGQADYGDGDLVASYLPVDPGQVILKAAEASPNHYSMKITYPDGEIHYLDIIVASFKYPGAKEAEPFLLTCKLGVCKAPVVVAAP
jgi:hypothetical protein